jgi:hypothetical protein
MLFIDDWLGMKFLKYQTTNIIMTFTCIFLANEYNILQHGFIIWSVAISYKSKTVRQ